MAKQSLTDVLAGVSPIATEGGSDGPAQFSAIYSTDQLWAVAAIVLQNVEGAVPYKGRDNNQLVFISTTDPGRPRRRNRRGASPTKQVTIYESGSVVYNNVAEVDKTKIGDAELAGGQLLAHALGFIKLSDSEVKELEKTANAKAPAE